MPEGSRFCLACGTPLTEARGRTRRFRLPGNLPTPRGLTIVSVALAVGGVVLLASGLWPWGLVALLGAAVLVLLPSRVDRREVRNLRARAAAMRDSVALRGRGQVEVFRVRRDLAELEAERARLYLEFGRAVYGDNDSGRTAARTALDGVVDRIRAKEAEIATLMRETEERVRRVQDSVQPTEVVHGEMPPEPPRIPEPWPPPDEADIPEPPQPGPGEPAPGPEEPEPTERPPAPGSRS